MIDPNTGEELTPQKSVREVQLEAEVEELKVSLRNAVEEMKVLRKNKVPDVQPNSVEETIQKYLSEQKAAEAAKAKEKALDIFKQKHKEFHPDNDPGGIKWSVIEREFNFFNTKELSSTEDFVAVLEKARQLATKPQEDTIERVNLDPSLPREVASPRNEATSKLTPKEAALAKQADLTEESFLKLKEKQPSIIAQMLAQTS